MKFNWLLLLQPEVKWMPMFLHNSVYGSEVTASRLTKKPSNWEWGLKCSKSWVGSPDITSTWFQHALRRTMLLQKVNWNVISTLNIGKVLMYLTSLPICTSLISVDLKKETLKVSCKTSYFMTNGSRMRLIFQVFFFGTGSFLAVSYTV